MRIACPHCGTRDLAEFTYHGDAANALARPDPASSDQNAWNAFVYDRANPLGDHDELWQHAGGCRRFLKVTRNTVTHGISATEMLGARS